MRGEEPHPNQGNPVYAKHNGFRLDILDKNPNGI